VSAIGDKIDAAEARLLQSTISGKQYALRGQPATGAWGDAFQLLRDAKALADAPVPVPPPPAPVPPPPAPSPVLWNGDFSTGDFSQYAQVYFMRTDGTSGSVVLDPAGSGKKVGRFEVRSGDSPGGFSNERAQIQMNSGEVEGTLSRWTWGVYLPTDFVDTTSFFNVITEWHHYSKTLPHDGSPPLTFQEIKGHYVCRIVNSNDPTQGNYWTEYDLGVAPRGGWSDFDVTMLHSSDPTKAFVDINRDGNHVLKITGHPTRFAGDYVNYLLAGWYRGLSPATQAMYLRNVRRLTP
jgi:hypothetical protein